MAVIDLGNHSQNYTVTTFLGLVRVAANILNCENESVLVCFSGMLGGKKSHVL